MYHNGSPDSPIASQIHRVGRAIGRQSCAHLCQGFNMNEREFIWTPLPAPPFPQAQSICILQNFLSKHFLVLNQQLAPVGSDLLGVHRMTLIHYDLASLYDFLVVFLPHLSPYKKLNCLRNTQEKGHRTQPCLVKLVPSPQFPCYSLVTSAYFLPSFFSTVLAQGEGNF